jgi:diphthamide biosynthesis protein 2
VRLLILYDVIYQQIAEEFYEAVLPAHENLILSTLALPGTSDCKETDPNHMTLYGRRVPSDSTSIDQTFYIGTNSRTILNFLLSPTCSGKPFTVYNPITNSVAQESSSAQKLTKLLMKRTYYIEKLKDSSSIGILVGTLAVEKYLAIIEHMKNVLRKANKKVYTVAIGEITPPKLANFPDIQIFILISCPECTILDSKEFFQPIVTPYEVELAFNQDREWAVNIVNDFRVLLPGNLLDVLLSLESFIS